MLQFNFARLLPLFSLYKEKTDLVIKSWKEKHRTEYADFTKSIEAISNGNTAILFDMYNHMKSCVPPEAQDFYVWFADLLSGKHPFNPDSKWAGRYTEKIAECMTKKQLWLGINLRNGEVDIYPSRQPDLLMVKSGTPIEIWNRMPQYVKAYIIEQTHLLLRNSKGCMLFSRLERKQLYQAIAFFANVFTLSQAVFIPGFLANLFDKVIEKQDSLSYCMYYFIVFDHGLIRMMNVFNCILSKHDVDQSGIMLIRSCVHMLVNHSLQLGIETKASWKNAAEGCNPEIWKDVLLILHQTKGKRGKKKRIQSLDDVFITDRSTLKPLIRQFLLENTEDICLAYLLRSLVKVGKIKSNTSYMTFHRAIEQFSGRRYGYDVPQKRYGELKELSLDVMPRETSFKRAKRIIDEWASRFAAMG